MAKTPTPEDMAALHRAAFSQSRPWSAAEFSGLLESPLTCATGDTRCFALIRVIADEAELLTIATHPDQQRKGLARQVMADCQAEAQRRGATEIFLEVAADNAPAQALYAACGFAVCGKRPGYYPRRQAAAVDALLMKRNLR